VTPEGWARLKEVFHDALQRPAAERAAFLDAACGSDTELRTEARKLLAAQGGAGSLIEKPPLGSLGAAAASSEPLGLRIGPYRVVSEIGRGGMGAVYRAVRADDQYRKEVALKLVQVGDDSEETVERFRRERQILAGLDHPNVARLLDGGATDDGRPYFVMELVQGKPIDRYCDHKDLGVRERLEIFRSVCGAVQYAHRNLIVHRDIKPGNILVTDEGVPKLLDFGIAKILRSGEVGGGATVTQAQAMTPFYASPEQVKGEPITTSSDVYSLGVLLYELLTGRRPYALGSRTQPDVFRAICEEEPDKPSAAARTGRRGRTGPLAQENVPTQENLPTQDLASAPTVPVSAAASAQAEEDAAVGRYARTLRGDLDTIVLMALRKEPARRYASVEELSEDIRRYLTGLPVRARKDTLGYRAQKFASRHRLAVAAAVLLVLSLVGGIVATARQARIAEANRLRAERRFDDVRALAHSLLFEIHDGIENLAGATKVRELLVRRGLEYLDSLSREASGDASLQRELAAAYQRVGDVQWSLGKASLGDTAGALQSQQKALALRAALARSMPASPDAQRELAASHVRVGDALRALGHADEGLDSYERALALPAAQTPTEADPGWLHALSGVYSRVALGVAAKGRGGDSVAFARKGLALAERFVAASPGSSEARRDLVLAHLVLARMLDGNGQAEEAFTTRQRAAELAEARARAEPDDAQALRDASTAFMDSGTALRDKGRLDDALVLYRKALAIDERLAAADPSNLEAKRDLGISHNKVAVALAAKKDWAGALEAQRRALAIQQAVAAANPKNTQVLEDLSDGHYHIARILKGSGDLAGAVESFRRAADIEERLSAADPDNAEVRDRLAESYLNLADALTGAARTDEALALVQKAVAICEALAKADPENPVRQAFLADAERQRGDALGRAAKGRAGSARLATWREARQAYERSLALWSPLDAKGLLEPDDKALLAGAEAGLARSKAALER
jgi:non-specific serine/threonine protein kinase/serine/threonine-protein kinase